MLHRMRDLPMLVAHQGGWDEALLVAAPVALFVMLLRIANRRAARLEELDKTRRDGPGSSP